MSYVAVWEGHGFRRAGGPRTPRAQPLTDMLTSDQFYVAHRCGGSNYPEMSEQGIAAAITRGYPAIEISVYRCLTGEWVCAHDWNTLGATGQNIPIGTTTWATLSEIPTLVPTTAPAPDAVPGGLLRLTDVMSLIPDTMVMLLDHKDTSMGQGIDARRQEELDDLFDYVSSFSNYRERFLWKVFRDGYATAIQAREEIGLRSWGIYYGAEIEANPNHIENFDVIGVEWLDSQTQFNLAAATGNPVIAHIISNAGQRNGARDKGADGYMNSNMLLMP